MAKVAEPLVKPANCTCEFPRLIVRNMCGHSPSCPVYVAWRAEIDAGRRAYLAAHPVRLVDTAFGTVPVAVTLERHGRCVVLKEPEEIREALAADRLQGEKREEALAAVWVHRMQWEER